MNPHIKKDFILNAFLYNQSLEKPFFLSYVPATDYYQKFDYFKFEINLPNNHKTITDKFYQSKTEELINNELSKNNLKRIKLSGDDFLKPYFKYYFEKNPEHHIVLLKFFNEFFPYSYSQIQFISQFDKKENENLIVNCNQWLQFSDNNLVNLNQLMIDKNFNEGFRVSIFKKFVEANLKFLNKTPYASKKLEEFLLENYTSSIDIIACNVVAIQSRKNDVKEELFDKLFLSKYSICFSDKMDIDKCLKFFQISGWGHSNYTNVIKLYHDYLKTSHQCEISCFFSQNNKEAEFFIKTNHQDMTIELYKKQLFSIFNFLRNNPEISFNNLNISKLLLNEKLNKNLDSDSDKPKTKSKI